MTAQLGVRDITGRASIRAVPPKKWIRFVADARDRDELEPEAAERSIVDGLLFHLVRPGSPALLVNYLTQGLAAGLYTARAFSIALLGYLNRSDNASTISASLLASIATALMSNPTGLDPGQFLPSAVIIPAEAPDVGTSASATSEEMPALSLLMPLLRLCAASPTPTPLVALAARLTSLIPPLPVPPFDVGLEGAQLSGALPEEVAKPLRECLAGLMSDLPLPPLAPTAPDGALFGRTMPDSSTSAFGDLGPMSGLAPLPVSSFPVPQAVAFLLEYAHRAQQRTSNTGYAGSPPAPPAQNIAILRIGKALTSDSQEFLTALLNASVARVLLSWAQGPSIAVRPYTFFTDELPVLLQWWRDNGDSKWPYPSNLQGALSEIFSANSSQLSNWFQAVNSIYTAKFSMSETDDEAGSYMQPDGWSMLNLEATTVRRYVELGLLDDEGTVALTGSPVKSAIPNDSLLERLSSSSPSHLPALEFFITYAAGAPRAFASEVVRCIEAGPQQPPPENFFTRLAGSPSLLAVVSAYITPQTLLDMLTTNWLDRIEDESARIEDPQGSLTRFGSSVVLAEALCAQFDLPLPDLLYDERRASNIGDLDEKELTSLNSWIKALFGSDGIDDETVMTTTAQGLTRFASTLVQQAVVAAMSGQIDLDTLHSGLSYYAQPLLSWCLGGVVSWLCSEIEREGMLSGMHLNVLQTLVLDSAFPEPLLRANAKAISHLLEPASGLQPVIQSSGFDHVAVRSRLQAVGGPDGSPLLPEIIAPPPLPTLRSELQSVRHLHLAAAGWEGRILDALNSALQVYGPLWTLETILGDMLFPSLIEMESNSGDPLGQFIALISALPLRPIPAPFATVIIDGYVPYLFGLRSPFVPIPQEPPNILMPFGQAPPVVTPPPPPTFAAHALHKLLRATLLAVDAEDEGQADTLASHLVEELAFQKSRPDADVVKRNKRLRTAKADKGLVTEQRLLLKELMSALEGDEELCARWPVLGGKE